MLKVSQLNAGYGKLHILYDIDFEAPRREITIVVGPNGSGKSTLLKALFGLATIYSGKIELENRDITRLPPHKRARLGLAYVPQTDNVFTTLTVEENLRMAGYLLEPHELKERIDLVLDIFPTLKEYLKKRAGALSGGERQMIAIAMCLIRDAKMLLLDEPTAQLAPKIATYILNKIVELRDRLGITIVLVEQNAKKALEIGDKAYLLVSGRVAFRGRAQELLEHRELGKLYLGLV